MMSFHRALAASPDPFTQYHVVKALSDAGCHRQALDIIEPYYNPTSASPELVAAMLTAAVAANDTHVTRWLLDHVTHANDQSVATAAYAARDFLAPQRSLTAQAPIQRPPLANPNPAHTPTPVVPGHPPVLQNPPDWLNDKPKHTSSPGTRKLVVAGVAAVLLAGVTSAHFLMRTTTHKSSLPATASQDYCGNLHTVLTATPANAAPTTAQRTQITAAARAMEVTAPQPLIATTQSWATTLTAELSAQVAHTAPALSYTAFVANQNKIVTWARLNCPAGTLPKNIVIIPITTTTTQPPTPQATMPQVTPTPTPVTPTPSPTTTTPRSTTPAQTSPAPTPTPAPTPSASSSPTLHLAQTSKGRICPSPPGTSPSPTPARHRLI
jgi:hypothetical protein